LQVASGRRSVFEIYGGDYSTPDGTCLRDYVHVMDIAQAHLLALSKVDSPGFRAFNIGTGKSHSVKQVCEAVKTVTGRELKLKIGAWRPGDPAVLCASPERIAKEFGWKASHSDLTDIVRSAWDWECSQCETPIALVRS